MKGGTAHPARGGRGSSPPGGRLTRSTGSQAPARSRVPSVRHHRKAIGAYGACTAADLKMIHSVAHRGPLA